MEQLRITTTYGDVMVSLGQEDVDFKHFEVIYVTTPTGEPIGDFGWEDRLPDNLYTPDKGFDLNELVNEVEFWFEMEKEPRDKIISYYESRN